MENVGAQDLNVFDKEAASASFKTNFNPELIVGNKGDHLVDIRDDMISANKQRKLTLEERLSQIISPEEVRTILDMIMRVPSIRPSDSSHIVDTKR
jgi:hypothetical protein